MNSYRELLKGFFQKAADEACATHFSDGQLENIVSLTPQYALTVGAVGLIGAACAHEVKAWGDNAELNSKGDIRFNVLLLLSNHSHEIYRDKELRSAYDLYYILMAAEYAGEGSLLYRGAKHERQIQEVDASMNRLYKDRLIRSDARPIRGLYRFLAPALPGFFASKFGFDKDEQQNVKLATQRHVLSQDKYLIRPRKI